MSWMDVIGSLEGRSLLVGGDNGTVAVTEVNVSDGEACLTSWRAERRAERSSASGGSVDAPEDSSVKLEEANILSEFKICCSLGRGVVDA